MPVRWHGVSVALPALGAVALGATLAATSLPSTWAWLAPLPLSGVFALLAAPGVGARAAFFRAFLAGLGFFGVHLAWLPESLGSLFGPAGAVPAALLPLPLALMWGVAGGATRGLTGRLALAALPFAWTLLDGLRSLGPLGFTWGTLGYSFAGTPIVQVADLGGVGLLDLLVTGLAAGGAAMLLQALGHSRLDWRWFALAPVAAALSLAYGVTRPQPARPDKTALLVQGSVDPLRRARERQASELVLYDGLTRQGLARAARRGTRVNLVVWPETAAPASPEVTAIARTLDALNVPMVVGAPSLIGSERRNSAFAYDRGVRGRFDKVKLVPFGEFFPLRKALGFVYGPIFSALGLSGLKGETPGGSPVPLSLSGQNLGVYICYESTFPAVARALVNRGAGVLVNISNDAWFGRGVGAEQHFLMGRVRAIETRRYLLRAGNDGVTAAIDPSGRTLARLPRGARGALIAPYAELRGLTPYTRLGDWPAVASALALALLARCGRSSRQGGALHVS
ncbi:MAG TPA: apolipoprotein N-acyltransferase [Deinococcales bacterium]|nr:apolipoprotein N-acyltransferase [Deinococcales bacterium]